MKRLLAAVLVLASAAYGEDFFFENVTPEGRQDIAVTVIDDSVLGSLSQTAESGNAYGTFHGERGKDGVFRVRYSFEVEGSTMSEEMVFKLSGDRLLMGQGELEEGSEGLMVLKDPAKVEFSKVFERVPLTRVETTGADGQSVVGALEGPVSQSLKVPVVLNAGEILIAGDWALYDGVVSPADPEKPIDKATAEKLTNSRFRGFVQRDGDGPWKVVRWGFMDENGEFVFDEDEGESEPWQLLEAIELSAMSGGC